MADLADIMARMVTKPEPLTTNRVSPPDDNGIRWHSNVTALLIARADRPGSDDHTELRNFLHAMHRAMFTYRECGRVEAHLIAPSPHYRAAAAQYLGVPESQAFTPIQEETPAN